MISKSSDFQNTDASKLGSKICRNYIDQCFTLVTNNTIQRGCLNDDGIIHAACNNDDICETCSENNCNGRKIQSELCVICDSKLDAKCRREPHDLMWDQCPFESIHPMGCFMYEKDRHVQRGCISSQNSNFRDLCLTEGDTCKYCFGDFCNKKPHFTRCRICDSNTNGEDCVRWPWKTQRKTCKSFLDECFTYVGEDGIVTRGCFHEFQSNGGKIEIDDNTCVLCSDDEDGCNDKAIKPEQCITCDSKIDEFCTMNATFSSSEICARKTINPLGCFHFINQTDNQTKRGCVANLNDQDRKRAIEQVNEWKYCVGRDNCNSKDAFASCISCNSSVDGPNCISDPSQSKVKLCNNYDDSCYSFINSNEVSRGCISDLHLELLEKCRSSPGKCETCSNDSDVICNKEAFSAATCIACDSDSDYRCRNQPELLEEKLCSLIDSPTDDLGCFLDFNEDQNRVQRGCISDLKAQQRQKCLSDSDQCKACFQNNCNKKIGFQKCFSCTSMNNSNCVQNAPLDVAVTCPNYLDKCLTAIDGNGFITRQCASDMYSKSFNKSEVCEDDMCNGEIFPSNRIQCFQCDGDDSCDKLRSNVGIPLELKPCTVFNQYDQCFMYLDAGKCVFCILKLFFQNNHLKGIFDDL